MSKGIDEQNLDRRFTSHRDWYEWIETNPRDFMERIEAGEKGNPDNPMAAAHIAFGAGVEAGIAVAARRLARRILYD